jgi:hypothetical protein
MCADVVKDALVANLRPNGIGEHFWACLGDSLRNSLRCSTVRAGLHAIWDPEAARTTNLLPRWIRVLNGHSLVLVPSATIQYVLGFGS